MIYEKIISRRTIRRYELRAVSKEILIKCVDAARLSPSAANRQPLKYVIVDDEALLEKVFITLRWAGYLPNYPISSEEMSRAYIVILLDKNISSRADYDVGIAAMSISMVAFDEGISSCILASADRERLRNILRIPESLDIMLVVAIGYSAEKSVVEKVKNDDIRYWLDDEGVLHVPKRELESIVKWNGF